MKYVLYAVVFFVIWPIPGMLVVGLVSRLTKTDIHWPTQKDRDINEDDRVVIIPMVIFWPIVLVIALVLGFGRWYLGVLGKLILIVSEHKSRRHQKEQEERWT